MDFRISSIEELRYALSLESIQKVVECEGVPPLFDGIAKFLIEECVIVTYDGREYGFLNIEFYLYNKNHKDIITHPRISKALQWYINDFGGIDLNFESIYEESDEYYKSNSKRKPILNDKCCFGGILIRNLKWLNGPADHQKISGPLACAELFRVCDAKSGECDFPKLTMKKSGLQYADIDKKARWNILRNNQDAKKKVGYILSEYVIEAKDDMIKEFENYKDKHYCYEIKQ